VAQLFSLGVMSASAKKFPSWTVAAVAAAVLGNVIAALIPVHTLLQMPPGSSGRLMVEAALAFIVAAATLLIVIVLAGIALFRERQRILAVIAICLAFTPFFFSGWVMNRVADMRHIFLEP